MGLKLADKLVESSQWSKLTGFLVEDGVIAGICRVCGNPYYKDEEGYGDLWPHIEPDCHASFLDNRPLLGLIGHRSTRQNDVERHVRRSR
jgi:hypothetical protein